MAKAQEEYAGTPLAQWLVGQLAKRHMTAREVALKAGLGHGTIYRYLAGGQAAPPKCKQLAAFFGVPDEQVLYLAGHIDPPPDHDLFTRQVGTLARDWPPDRKRRFLKLAESFE